MAIFDGDMVLFARRLFQDCCRPSLRGVLAVLCVVTSGCLHGRGHSIETNVPKTSPQSQEDRQAAAGFDKFFLHDECTGEYPPQPDTCLHDRLHQQSFKFGGKSGILYEVTLRIRGIFEPTTITAGETPDSEHPYFQVGGMVSTQDWSQWAIDVSEPKQTYWLNHY